MFDVFDMINLLPLYAQKLNGTIHGIVYRDTRSFRLIRATIGAILFEGSIKVNMREEVS